MKKKLLLSIGFISLGLGVIGSILPLLPTTPFILLSAYCFSKSSDKFYHWLISIPKFGDMIKNWNEKGTIDRKSKFLCLVSISGVIVYFSGFSDLPLTPKIILPTVLIPVLTYVLTRPER